MEGLQQDVQLPTLPVPRCGSQRAAEEQSSRGESEGPRVARKTWPDGSTSLVRGSERWSDDHKGCCTCWKLVAWT